MKKFYPKIASLRFGYLLLLLSNPAMSQDYGYYYQCCIQADSLIYVKQYDQALSKYKSAFNSVDYVHYRYLKLASNCAMKVKDFESGYRFIRQSILNSGEIGFFSAYRRDVSAKFKRTQYYRNIKDSTHAYIEEHKRNTNWEYSAIIDSLHYIDQRIIRGSKWARGNYAIDLSKLPENMADLDDSLFHTLLDCIEKWGFPSEELVDANSAMVLHHNLRLEKNEIYHEMAINALREGKYDPFSFGSWYAQYKYSCEGIPFFNPRDSSDLTEENLQRFEQNRKKFYRKPLSAYKIKLMKEGYVRMKPLW